METTHTPGPWINRQNEILGPFKSNKTICEIPQDKSISNEESEANARLISAAPELLEALIEARKLLLDMGHTVRYLDEDCTNSNLWANDENYISDQRFLSLEEAINKATGK